MRRARTGGIRGVGRARTTGMQQRRDRRFIRPRRVAALLAVGAAAVAGLAIAATTSDQVHVYPATIDATRVRGATAELEVTDDGAILVAAGLPERDGTYQVWLMPKGADAPKPSVLFLPHHDGTAEVAIPRLARQHGGRARQHRTSGRVGRAVVLADTYGLAIVSRRRHMALLSPPRLSSPGTRLTLRSLTRR